MVDGHNIKEWSSDNLVDLPTVQNIVAQVLEVLVYLHNYVPPIIHRDIKPLNLMRRWMVEWWSLTLVVSVRHPSYLVKP